MSYRLTLTAEDIEAIAFAGDRYSWSEALSRLDVGENEISEAEAWELVRAFEADTEGGHSPFPLLEPRSRLHERLMVFWTSIV